MTTFVRTFEGYAPPPRFEEGAKPFSKAQIQESPIEGDPVWTTLETITLDPVDTDPTEPASRNFSTSLATLEPAIYRLVWEDDDGVQFNGSEAFYPPLPAWAPSVAEVAAFIPARTRQRGGKRAMTFNDLTQPTGREVERLIAQACFDVSTEIVREPCSAKLRGRTGSAAALYTAMLVEQGYWPEQSTAAGSSFKSLEALWTKRIAALDSDIRANCPGEDGAEEEIEGQARPAGNFEDGLALYGRDYPCDW